MEDNKYLENIDFTENFLDEDKIKTDLTLPTQFDSSLDSNGSKEQHTTTRNCWSNAVKSDTVGLKQDLDFDDVPSSELLSMTSPPLKVAGKMPATSTTGKVNNPYETKIMISNSRAQHNNKRYRSNKTVPPIMRKVPVPVTNNPYASSHSNITTNFIRSTIGVLEKNVMVMK